MIWFMNESQGIIFPAWTSSADMIYELTPKYGMIYEWIASYDTIHELAPSYDIIYEWTTSVD